MADHSHDYADEQTLAALVTIIRSMATTSTPPVDSKIKLPGEDTFAKALVEQELSLLNQRIHNLELRANSSVNSIPPVISDEICQQNEENSGLVLRSKKSLVKQSKISLESPMFKMGTAHITVETLEDLKSHIDGQSKLLDEQRVELSSVNRQLLEQKKVQEKALRVLEADNNVTRLTRELRKHQKANEAFQKALREIGEIVTAVARGDLSKKAKMNSVEMDPEITTFKRTINTMMDQLQVFSSEVSRVAREVGTEGILGGQARIEGVDGTWKELTNNGKLAWAFLLNFIIDTRLHFFNPPFQFSLPIEKLNPLTMCSSPCPQSM